MGEAKRREELGLPPRQKKIAAALQKELSTMLQETIREQGITNLLVSVTKVYVTIDLSLAKIFLSIFPKKKCNSSSAISI